MATKEIVIQPGEALPPSIENAFAEAFGTDALAKAQKRGAKIRLVITTPWPKAKREKKTIDQNYVDQLKALAPDEAKLEGEINTLSGPDILKVASLLEVPMSKSSKLSSLRAQLAKSLRSEIVWKSIAGQHGVSADAQSVESTATDTPPDAHANR
jgi:hypothetical protein